MIALAPAPPPDLPLHYAAPAAILAVLDARPPGHTAARWVALPHVSVVAHGCASTPSPWDGPAMPAGLGSAALAAAAGWGHAEWAAAAAPAAAAALHALLCASWLMLACSLPTDLFGLAAPASPSASDSSLSFFCGNLGLLLASVKVNPCRVGYGVDLMACLRCPSCLHCLHQPVHPLSFGSVFLPPVQAAAEAGVDPMDVRQRQCSISMMRGSESGGLVALVAKGKRVGGGGGGGLGAAPRLQADGVRRCVAPSKRQNLAVLLGKQFRAAAGKAELADGHGLFVGGWGGMRESTPALAAAPSLPAACIHFQRLLSGTALALARSACDLCRPHPLCHLLHPASLRVSPPPVGRAFARRRQALGRFDAWRHLIWHRAVWGLHHSQRWGLAAAAAVPAAAGRRLLPWSGWWCWCWCCCCLLL